MRVIHDTKEMKVMFCPDCKSTDVKYVFELGNIFGVMPKKRCMGCGREGEFPLLVTSEKELRSKVITSSKHKKLKQ